MKKTCALTAAMVTLVLVGAGQTRADWQPASGRWVCDFVLAWDTGNVPNNERHQITLNLTQEDDEGAPETKLYKMNGSGDGFDVEVTLEAHYAPSYSNFSGPPTWYPVSGTYSVLVFDNNTSTYTTYYGDVPINNTYYETGVKLLTRTGGPGWKSYDCWFRSNVMPSAQ
jgi:hypothetical protein